MWSHLYLHAQFGPSQDVGASSFASSTPASTIHECQHNVSLLRDWFRALDTYATIMDELILNCKLVSTLKNQYSEFIARSAYFSVCIVKNKYF